MSAAPRAVRGGLGEQPVDERAEPLGVGVPCRRLGPPAADGGQVRYPGGVEGLAADGIPGIGTPVGRVGADEDLADGVSPPRADGERQMSVAVNLIRWNAPDPAGDPRPHPVDDALKTLYGQAMCATTDTRGRTPGPTGTV
ncbi:hypothetical protein ACFY3N_19555 [Streptomyces sp. NPDC000348]|uniref:hypothetical protein n=1 Tax=Streptomyces sp. NPDC000348 TaxID=3364538 RepID=UPI0036ACC69D